MVDLVYHIMKKNYNTMSKILMIGIDDKLGPIGIHDA